MGWPVIIKPCHLLGLKQKGWIGWIVIIKPCHFSVVGCPEPQDPAASAADVSAAKEPAHQPQEAVNGWLAFGLFEIGNQDFHMLWREHCHGVSCPSSLRCSGWCRTHIQSSNPNLVATRSHYTLRARWGV